MAASSSIFSFKPDVSRFLCKAVLFLCLMVVLDQLIGAGLRYFYFRTTSGLFYRLTYSLDKTDQDILIFGSSRASHHYVPDVFEKGLKMSFYNNGEDGQGILMSLAILRSTLKRYVPKIIILDILPSDLTVGSEFSFERLGALLPYYTKHPELRDLIERRSRMEKIKMLSQIYPFNSAVLGIVIGNFEFNKKRKGDIKGYMPLPFGKEFQVYNSENAQKSIQIDPNKIRALEEFCFLASKAGSKVFLVVSPFYLKDTVNVQEIAAIKAISKKFNVPFSDNSQNDFFLHRKFLFSDMNHLNEKGALLFSEMLLKNISQSLQNLR